MFKQPVARFFSLSAIRPFLWFIEKLVAGWTGIANRAYASYLWPDSWQKDLYIHANSRVKFPERITFGKHVRIGPHCVLGAMGEITLGDYVRISEGACVETGGLDINASLPYPHIAKPIVIGNGVWLGFRSVVLAGVTIGDRSVIGAGAVVTKDIPADSIAVGSPARVFPKKMRTEREH